MKRIFTNDQESSYINALLYGDPGTGKTYSASTLPGKTVIISAEAGLKTLRGYEIEVWEIESWEDFEEAIAYLKKEKEKLGFDNVFVDSLTEMSKICADHILQERVAIYQARKQNTKTMFHDQRTLEDYGLAKGRMDRVCRAFRDLPYNIFFSALCNSQKDELRGGVKCMPLIQPASMAQDLPGIFDHVILSKTDIDDDGDQVFWWETANSERIMAKDRSGNLPAKMRPDWKMVFEAYQDQEKKES